MCNDRDTGYNYHPNDRVWYRDPATGGYKEGSCYQVEIKHFKKPDSPDGRKLTYLISLDGSPQTLKVRESDLLTNTSVGLVPGPETPRYNTVYKFHPNDPAWIANKDASSVRAGIVYQVEIKISKETDTTSFSKILYYVNYSDSVGTVVASSEEIFCSADEAWAYLGITIAPTPPPTETNPGGGGGPGGNTLVSKVNGDNVTLFKGMPVYIKQTDGTVARASNNESVRSFLGFVWDESIPPGGSGRIVTEGSVSNTVQGWNNVIDEISNGLVQGNKYYIGSTGKISSSPPTSGFQKGIGLAVSNIELDIQLDPHIKL